jgi:glucose/arabinose dehydrogenase
MRIHVRTLCRLSTTTITFLSMLLAESTLAQPFRIAGPGVNPADFRITTFAEGLNFPIGMAELSDGSVLAAVSNGSNFFGSDSGRLIRLADTNDDGVADEQMTLVDRVAGGALTTVRVAGDLVFTAGQKKAINVYRLGETPTDPLQTLGSIDLSYPAGSWLHPHSALAVRQARDDLKAYELYFQVGSRTNFDDTTDTVGLNGLGYAPSERMEGDSVYRVTLHDDGTDLIASDLTQIATGLRNAAGFTFNAAGDLYLQDNGIDGVQDANEPTSADELNVIRAADIGGAVEDFGFPDNYIAYRTDEFVGGQGIAPLIAFQPLPTPDGAESEGPNDIALAPKAFPAAIRDGIFVTMHGKFSRGGVANEENPLVFANLIDTGYFHFIGNDERSIGHIDGLLSTNDSLYLADIAPSGEFGAGAANSGKIYRIQSVVPESSGHCLLVAACCLLPLFRKRTKAGRSHRPADVLSSRPARL